MAKQSINVLNRHNRMTAARQKGTHSKSEWDALKIEFSGRYVRCGTDEYNVERDHIIPVYQGGSDAISNIQPLCARCNASKGPDDYDWKSLRRLRGF
jgi:5-methylcytosine-specific restriction endonuclease McrA